MRRLKTKILQLAAGLSCSILLATSAQANLAQSPLFLTQAIAPLVMLNMSNDNQLFFQAYPEYADLTGDGNIEFTYTHSFEYYGYFDPNQCYSYDTTNNRYSPAGAAIDGYCDNVSGGDWSGNFLNWVSMARIDVVRKILYGGYRSTDDTDLTVLERSYLPNDAHSWVRYYNGDDLSKLTPYGTTADRVRTEDDGPLAFNSSTSFQIPSGSRNATGDRQTLTLTGWNNQGDIQIGDQIRVLSTPTGAANAATLEAVVYSRSYNNNQISVQITNVTPASRVGDTLSNWRIENLSRVGVSFCNTTATDTTRSQNVTDPPLIRAARGDYSLWTANERWQCQWSDEENRTGTNSMQVGGVNFSNGNYMTASGLRGNSDNPVRSEVGLGQQNYVARVEVCNESPVNGEACTEYPNGEFKPTGLLQEYGASGDIDFGLLTGTYDKNLSGGTLRKNIKTFSDEVDEDTGQFVQPLDGDGDAIGSIVGSMNALRIYGYNHDTGVYTGAGDDCGVGVNKSDMEDGKCMNWGNPQAEMFLEAVRYFAGEDPTSAFEVTDDRISGLTSEDWDDPLSNDNWCANLNLVNFNASYSSFDGEELDGISDLNTNESVDYWTNRVGEGEGLHATNTTAFFGGGNALCTAKSLGFLADVTGLCPEAPNQDGTYHIAGLAHYAWAESIRNDLQDANDDPADVHVRTHGVALASAIPRIDIPRPGETEPAVTILPACENQGDGGLRCALTDFRVIDLDTENGTGSFFIQWDVHEWGSDFDMDINGTLSYEITDDEITVTTRTWADSSGRSTGFGYITSGTEKDGYHAHSGINSYTYEDPTGATDCEDGCSVNDDPTSYTYELSGDGPAQLLREPLYYAAKWGGYDKSRDFPSDVSSWDRNGDGLPDNYYFAIDPARLAENLSQVFRDIVETSDSATAVATNSSRLDTDTKVFQAQFDSGGWFGDLLAFDFVDQDMMWSAATELRERASATRRILTMIDGDAEFLGATIPAAMDVDGLGDQRMDWLYGQQVPGLRDRTFNSQREILGDIVNSNPQFVGRANYGNRLIGGAEGNSYSMFRANEDYRDRPDMVYVGANDGMLHGFSVDSGEEWFAYVPSELLTEEMPGEDYAPLAYLSDPDYEHRYFVDGTPIVRDAYLVDEFNNAAWHTVLVGTMGNGGRTVFALDVTKPQDDFDTDNVLWEFTHDELGYGVTDPEIVRLPSGEWAAVFGNGYGTDSGESGVFIVNLSDPEDYTFISSENGTPGTQNAMAPAMVTDWGNNNRVASRGYVGDLQGRLYRIEFDDDDLDEATLTQIFRTQNGKPITVKPVGQPHPSQTGAYVVSFGTGSYFRNQDRLDNSVQALYGIIDDGNVVNFNQLLQQEIIFQDDVDFTFDGEDVTFALRATTDHQLDENNPEPGWYLRLEYDGTNEGERVVSRPSLAPGAGRNAVRFTTLIPDIDPCGIGRTGYLMELDILTGSRPEAPVFDLDGDGLFDDEDMITIIVDGEEITVPVSGVGGVTQGEELSTVQDIQGVEQIVQPVDPDDDNPDPSPGLLGDQGSSGRIGWEQLR